MARGIKNGWDFIKVGGIYHFKEDHFIGIIKVLEDNSDEDAYRFKIKVLKANCNDIGPTPFEVLHSKTFHGVYSGMVQFYEYREYNTIPAETPWPYDYTKQEEE